MESQNANTGSIIHHRVQEEHQPICCPQGEVVYLQQIIWEMRRQGLEFEETQPKVHCKTFEDNSGALEMANIHKLKPRTKHLAVSWHHFRHHVMNGDITVVPISREDQLADCMTKYIDFQTLRPILMNRRKRNRK